MSILVGASNFAATKFSSVFSVAAAVGAGASVGAGVGGGGLVGAVVLSRYVRPGTVTTTPYNHYSMLRTIEDLFGLDHLGYAGQDGLGSFDLDVFVAVP